MKNNIRKFIRNNIVICFAFIAVLFTGCQFFIGASGSRNDSNNGSSNFDQMYTKKTDYPDGITYTSDSAGIHFALNLKEDLITEINVYEIEDQKEKLVAQVKPVQDKYRFLIKGSPVGEKIYEEKNGEKTLVESSWHTNYLNGEVNLDFDFVSPGKTYNYIFHLKAERGKQKDKTLEHEYEVPFHGNNANENDEISNRFIKKEFGGSFKEYYETINYYENIKVKAASEIKACSFLESKYERDIDAYTFDGLDKKSELSYFNDKNEIKSFSSFVSYECSTGDNLISIPVSSSEVSVSDILAHDEKSQFGVDYNFKNLGFVINYTDLLKPCSVNIDQNLDISSFTESEKTEIKRYYTDLYNQRSFVYNTETNCAAKIQKTINAIDRRIDISVSALDEGNIISFTLPKKASQILIYNGIPAATVLVGKMTGVFESGKQYQFIDYLANPESVRNYYITYDGIGSKHCEVKTKPQLKYTPNPLKAYYDTETYNYKIEKNLFDGRLPENFTGSAEFEFEIENLSFYRKEKNKLSVTDKTEEIDVKGAFTYWFWDDEIWNHFAKPNTPYKVTFMGTIEKMYYENYGEFDDVSQMGKIFIERLPEDEDNPGYPGGSNGDTDWEEEERKQRQEYYEKNIKPFEIQKKTGDEEDYTKFVSFTETSEGIEFTIHIADRTSFLNIKRMEYDPDRDVYEDTAIYNFNLETLTGGDVKIVDYCVSAGKAYTYQLNGNSVEEYDEEKGVVSTYAIGAYQYVSPTNDSPYCIVALPDLDTENYRVEWNVYPEGYKNLLEYDGDHFYEREMQYYSWLLGEKHYHIKTSAVFDGRINNGNFATIKYECVEIDESEKSYIDIYGNKVELEIIKNDPRFMFDLSCKLNDDSFTKYWQKSFETSEFGSTRRVVPGKYKPVSASGGIFSNNGYWYYKDLKIDSSASNVYEYKSE